ncbi:MAG: hypothetical protein QW735_00020 [archaeon]
MDFQIKLISCSDVPPDTLSAAGALSCFEEKASFELLEELTEQKIKLVIKESFGRGHGSVGDQNFFSFSLKTFQEHLLFKYASLPI